jgi:hypothetical protein
MGDALDYNTTSSFRRAHVHLCGRFVACIPFLLYRSENYHLEVKGRH